MKNTTETLRQKNRITEIKKSVDRFTCRLDIAEKNDLEDSSEDVIQNKAWKVKNSQIQKTS